MDRPATDRATGEIIEDGQQIQRCEFPDRPGVHRFTARLRSREDGAFEKQYATAPPGQQQRCHRTGGAAPYDDSVPLGGATRYHLTRPLCR